MSTGHDIETWELTEAFNEECSAAVPEAVQRDDEGAADLANHRVGSCCGVAGRGGSFGEAACGRATVEGKIAGIPVRGIVYLLDVDGCVFDFKTSSTRPNGISADSRADYAASGGSAHWTISSSAGSPQLLERPIRILAVGCGGNGSAIVSGLPYLREALVAFGHPGELAVTLSDPDMFTQEFDPD